MTKKSKGDFFTRLRALDHLTPTETKIVLFVEENPKLLAFGNLTRLSDRAKVSKASMIRFLIHRLGYADFAEFQAERQEYLASKLDSPINLYLRQPDSQSHHENEPNTIFERHTAQIMQDINSAAAHLKPETLIQVADILAQIKRPLYILGQGTSYSLAHMMATDLKYIRPNVFLMGDEHTSMPAQLFQAVKGDVLFVITRRRYSRNSNRITRYLKEKGLTIILATDSENAPLSHLMDMQIAIPAQKCTTISSLAAWVVMIESLVLMVAERCPDSARTYGKKADEILLEFNYLES